MEAILGMNYWDICCIIIPIIFLFNTNKIRIFVMEMIYSNNNRTVQPEGKASGHVDVERKLKENKCPICLDPIKERTTMLNTNMCMFYCCGANICKSCSDDILTKKTNPLTTCPCCQNHIPENEEEIQNLIHLAIKRNEKWAGFVAIEHNMFKTDIEIDKMLRQSATLGYIPAQACLGSQLSKQKGKNRLSNKEFKEGIYWSQVAADAGSDVAQYNIGTYYITGIGVDKDISKGLSYIKQSAEQGLVEAQLEIARRILKAPSGTYDKIISSTQVHLYLQHICQYNSNNNSNDNSNNMNMMACAEAHILICSFLDTIPGYISMKKGIRMGYHHNSDNTGNSHNNNNNKSNPWDPELYLKPIEELFKSNCYRCGIIL